MTVAVGSIVSVGVAAGNGVANAATAVVSHSCEGPFGNQLKFLITAQDAIPAGSSWNVSTSRIAPYLPFIAVADSPAISVTRLSDLAVRLTATAPIPASTVVRVEPSRFYYSSSPATSVSIVGYGGSDTVSYTLQQQPC